MVFNTYHHTRTCLDEKIEIDEKKRFKNFFLTNFLKGYFKVFPEKLFFSKKHFFVFCRKFGRKLEILSNQYSQLKKQVKVDPETRSYDFLTKTREKKYNVTEYPYIGHQIWKENPKSKCLTVTQLSTLASWHVHVWRTMITGSPSYATRSVTLTVVLTGHSLVWTVNISFGK